VNPIAGMGGRVGLKGSDGIDTLRRARELGAVKTSPQRAIEALKHLKSVQNLMIFTYPGEMGEDEARVAGLNPTVIGTITSGETSSADTRRAALEMATLGADLLLFAGGDGTARDIYEAVEGQLPVLGIPTGVKIHSGVYAVSPASAGELAARFLRGDVTAVREAGVMDIDEEAFRGNRLSAQLYGLMMVPVEPALLQGSKETSVNVEEENLKAIALDIADGMEPETLYIMGPGGTIAAVTEHLGVDKTLLGVDVLENGKLIGRDVNEATLLDLLRGRKAKIVVTIIGGQGFIFGRGNQQISAIVIRAVGKENLVVVATPEKLATLHGRPLLVDTGDLILDSELSGYIRVITDYGRCVVYRVSSG
jgi:predicted polyphosphate/ATP-dependent NAD kinase